MSSHLGRLLIGAWATWLVAQAPQPLLYARDVEAVAVGMGEDYYQPIELSIAVGTPVRWTNEGARAHTVNSFEGQFTSNRMAPGDQFTFTFLAPGSYGYFCDYHPWMSGTIMVTPGDASVR